MTENGSSFLKGVQYWFNWFIAALGMDLASFYALFLKKDPTTDKTDFQRTQQLEKEQDPRERERLEKSGTAGKLSAEQARKQAELQAKHEEAAKKEAKRQQDEYNKLTEQEKQQSWSNRDKIEQEQQAKQYRTAYSNTPKARESEISSAPKTTAPKEPISPAYDNYEARRSSALTLSKPSAPAQPAPTKSPTIAPAKPPADPQNAYVVSKRPQK